MKQTSLFNRGLSVLFWGHWLRVLVISAQKLDKRKLTAENTRCWQPSHCYLLSSHRHLQLPVDTVNIQGSSLCWFACPLSQWLSTLTEVIHLVGEFIMERKHRVNADCLWSSWSGDLQQESWTLGSLSSSNVRSIWHLPLSVCYQSQQENPTFISRGMIPEYLLCPQVPWCWIPSGNEGWGCREETDLPGKNNVWVLWSLEITISFKCCGFVWFRVGGSCVSPCGVILKLCVCVFPQMFPSYTAQVSCELSKHFLSLLHTGYTLPDSFLNSIIPQVW